MLIQIGSLQSSRLGDAHAYPPIWAATWEATVPVVTAPERVICVARTTYQLALMPRTGSSATGMARDLGHAHVVSRQP